MKMLAFQRVYEHIIPTYPKKHCKEVSLDVLHLHDTPPILVLSAKKSLNGFTTDAGKPSIANYAVTYFKIITTNVCSVLRKLLSLQ